MKIKNLSAASLKQAERGVILFVVLIMVATVVTTLLASRQQLEGNWHILPWQALGILALATAIESFLRFYRYVLTSRSLGIRVSAWRQCLYYVAGYAFIPTPGKVGIIIRLWLLRRNHHVPYSRSSPLLVMDFISDALANFLLTGIAWLALPSPRFQLLGFLLTAGCLVGMVVLMQAPHVLRMLVKAIYALSGHRKKRLFAKLLHMAHTSRTVLGPRILIITTFLSTFGWFLVGLGIAVLLEQMGTPIGWAYGNLANTLATIGGFLSMMPAGVGGTEVTMAGILNVAGAPLATAILATALIRFVALWSTVLIGLAVLPFVFKDIKKKA